MKTETKAPKVIESLSITDTSSDGRAVGRSEGKVIFVEHAVPGDVADVFLYKSKKSFAEGRIEKMIKYSDNRLDAFCEHFGVCGGCKWQNMKYDAQLSFKQKQVTDALQRIGHLEFSEPLPIVGSLKTTHYRNKLEYTFSNKRWLTKNEMGNESPVSDADALGFHIPQRFDKILDINTCYLQTEPSNSIRLAVKKFAIENGLSFFDLYEQHGLLRNLITRTSGTSEIMVIVVFAENDPVKKDLLLNFLKTSFPQISSLQYVVNEKKNDTIFDQDVHLFSGKEFIIEEMEGLKFKVGPKTFFQTNSSQALTLYRIAKDFAGLNGTENVYDLYTGTGTIACFVAASCKSVIGVDNVPDSIVNAGLNAEANQIKNARFVAGDIRATLTNDFIAQYGKPDVIITDPPRAGMHEDVVKKICEIHPEKVVYISCNPASQARDLQLMKDFYTISKVQPVDMFPHTHHVENVVLLLKK